MKSTQLPAYGLKPDRVWNPVREYPRNAPCPCGKPKKFKACCLATIPETVSTLHAAKLADLTRKAQEAWASKQEADRAKF